jgi:N-acetylated-alpha-linked acidic dipeptidase
MRTKLGRHVSQALAALADPERAAPMQRYMKSEMPFRGVPTPVLRKTCQRRSQPRTPQPAQPARGAQEPRQARGEKDHMKLKALFAAAATLSLIATTATAELRSAALHGFRAERIDEQLDLERRFDAELDPDDLAEWRRACTPRPHHLGSPQVRANAERIAEMLRSWGFEVAIEEFQVLFPTPRTRELELLAPTPWRADLDEPVVEGDSTSEIARREGLPPFNAYSIDGDVTGELVYVNQGLPRDYEELELRGIDVRGKIVLARYGGSWRGIKPKVAAEKGAIACLIYSDPRDDGYFQGDVYPKGPFKTAGGAQRGSVMDMPTRAGDPLTPGYGAVEGADRLELSEVEVLTRIPVLPISWANAQPLLEALEGPVAPPAWRGALPLTYHLGPGPARVRLKLEFDWRQVTAYDVIARLEGSELPDQWVLRGNHHDAWVIGASDPISGLISLLAEAKAIGTLARNGWRPRRSLVFAAWDGEEQGLLGSTEWAEHHRDELGDKAVAYINTDGSSRGFLGVGGSHTLEPLLAGVAGAVPDPQTDGSVGERTLSRRIVTDEKERERLLAGGGLRLSALGSGSDYTPFLQHLGIASINLGYGGEGRGGEYHTAFDSADHYERFKDPDFAYGVTLARTAGRVLLRLADADVLPFDLRTAAATYSRYVDEVIELADKRRSEIEVHNRLLDEGHRARIADPTKVWAAPETKAPAPHLDFSPLLNARDRLDRAAADLGDRLSQLDNIDPATAAELDVLLYRSERTLTREEGLPRRPWFRHQIYAPGYYTGYGVKTLPGVREAIEEGLWEEAAEQIRVAASALERLAANASEAIALVDRP